MSSSRPVGVECTPGSQVWIACTQKSSNDSPFQKGKVLAVDDTTATVRTDDRVVQIDLLMTVPMMVNNSVEADMTSLHHIHEAAILWNLHQRSLQNEPYTFMGSVLVSINPLRPVPDPFPPGSTQSSSPPHPYVIADLAFQQMMFKNALVSNQSIIIAGESGSGKTESAKMVLAHLVAKTSSKDSAMKDLDKRLLGTSPILESFGNSVTLRNPNSSRFGKMMRLHFESNQLRGATIQSYLLERSRVTSHEPGERNFHIFYALLSQGKEAQWSHLGLESAENFRYIRPGMVGPKDGTMFPVLVDALQSVNVPLTIFEVLSGLLHLGEINFTEEDTSEGSVARVSDAKVLAMAAGLLGLQQDELSNVFCQRKLTVRGTTTITKRNARASGFARDAAVKAIYSSLFEWVVSQINLVLLGTGHSAGTVQTLGVLDIFGFESFKVNQFEQLLINYCNEALQGTFNGQIFVAEASLYQREGLFGSDEYLTRPPADNGLCVELFQSKTGLLAIIDSEGKSPDASDTKMLQRIHAQFGTHAGMIRPHLKEISRTFIVRHYCQHVVYTVGSFLEKNNDRLPEDMEAVLSLSRLPLIQALFPPLQLTGNKGPPTRSICAKFVSQIKTLVEDLENTKCSFIRCVKPNANMFRKDGDDSWFDFHYVNVQLNALNIPQTCEVLRNGFPTRLDYSVLVDLYWNVFPAEVLKRYNKGGVEHHRAFVQALFFAFSLPSTLFKLGHTKVFFRSGQLAQLDTILKSANAPSKEVLLRFRLCYVRLKWRRLLVASLALEEFQRRFLEVRKLEQTATKLQAWARSRLGQKQHQKWKRGALTVQKLWRGRRAREIVLQLKRLKIQEAKRRAELEARTKREREEAALQAKLEEERQEKQRLEQEEAQRILVEEALKKQEEETRLLEQREHIKRRQSVQQNRKSIAIRKSLARPLNTPNDGSSGDLNLRLKTLAVVPARKVTFQDSSDEDEDNFKSAGIKRQSRVKTTRAVSVVRMRKPSVHAEAAKARFERRSKVGPPKKTPKPAAKLVEEKSGLEKISTLAREEFAIKVKGFALVLVDASSAAATESSTAPAPAGASPTLFHKLKTKLVKQTVSPPATTTAVPASKSLLGSKKQWVRLYYVLDKPKRSLGFFFDANGKPHSHVELKATIKIQETSIFKQAHVVELSGPHMAKVDIAFESFEERRAWERDVREAVIGFRSAPLLNSKSKRSDVSDMDGDERVADLYDMYSDQLRQERINQLKLLLRHQQITQEEFDKTSQMIYSAPDPSFDEEDDKDDQKNDDDDLEFQQVDCPQCFWSNNTRFGRNQCVKCGTLLGDADSANTAASASKVRDEVLKPLPLKYPFAKEMAFEDGRVSAEMVGVEKSMDFNTYQEVVLFGIDLRFRDEEFSELELGWLVSHRLGKFQALYKGLVDSEGPLTAGGRKRIPPFPLDLKDDSPTACEEIGSWLNALFKLVPQGGKQTNLLYYEENDQGEEEEEEDDAKFTEQWRSVKDVETGDLYYFNKVSGETTWVNPFDRRAMKSLRLKLPENWEAVVDKESNDVYYWNTETLETSWEKPKLPDTGKKKKKLLDVPDLLHVGIVNKFLDLKRNTTRMDEMANDL